MFERFTERARRVVVLAQEEARKLNHNYIGTEHILLGLIREGEGVAAETLRSLGIRLETVRLEIEQIIGRGMDAPSGHIPFTPRAKKVLELSLRESQQLGHNYIGTEHILLGLVREGDGVAAQVLVKLGADLNRVRQQAIRLLHGVAGTAEGSQEAGVRVTRAAGSGDLAERLDEALARLGAIESRLARIDIRLARIEGRLGHPVAEGPGPEDTGAADEAGAADPAGSPPGGEVPGGEVPGAGADHGEGAGDGDAGDGNAAAGGAP